MSNIINAIKYDVLKRKMFYIINFSILLVIWGVLVLILDTLLGNMVFSAVSFCILILNSLYLGITLMFGVSKESTLLFQTPIKGVQYIIAKYIEFFTMLLPVWIVTNISVLVGINYLGIEGLGSLYKIFIENNIMFMIMNLSIFAFVFSVFIIVKSFRLNAIMQVVMTIIITVVIEMGISIVEEVIDKFMPYYYLSGYPEIGLVWAVLMIATIIILTVLAGKKFDKGLDYR